MPPGMKGYTQNRGMILLVQGQPTVGKTTVVGQLLDATEHSTGLPFELRVADIDGKLDPLLVGWDGKPRSAEQLSRVWHVPVSEDLSLSKDTGFAMPEGAPLGYEKLISLQRRFGDFGPDAEKDDQYDDWQMNRVLVYDDLTSFIELAIFHVLQNRAKGMRRKDGSLTNKAPSDYGAVQDLVWDYMKTWHKRATRRFHIIWTCHVDHISINLNKRVDEEDLKNAYASQQARAELEKKMGGDIGAAMMTLQSEKKYPLLFGKQLQEKFMSKFHVCWVERDPHRGPIVGTEPSVLYDARMPRGLPTTLSGKTALADIFNHYAKLNEELPE